MLPNCRDSVATAADLFATEAFSEFLSSFKTTPEQSITHDLGNITIDEGDLSDDDLMGGEDGAQDGTQEQRRQERERAQRRKGPHQKYKEILQDVADRKINEITIDLNDLADVCPPRVLRREPTLTPFPV
ncbi:MAG: hypothetical protein IMZ46_07250 [Acidobacteria bacterium]|nr:hypothetical protein [Acidobacteriota bacterium]